jgi:hypothetical protein
MFEMVMVVGLALKVKLGPETKPFHAVTRWKASKWSAPLG